MELDEVVKSMDFSQVAELPIILQHLGETLRLSPEQLRVRSDVIEAGDWTFLLESGLNSNLASIVKAIRNLEAQREEGQIPLLATRHMTAAGKKKCEQAGVSWLDLAGNAHL